MSAPRRIGVFGGTFDPPHVGHLVTAVNVRHELGLDRVLLVVANQPWQKVEREVTPAHLRLAMVRAAVEPVPGLEASDVEIRRGGASYTIDTVTELERHGDVEVVVVLGSDAAAGLGSWERADELRRRTAVAVVARPGSSGATPPPGWRWERVVVPRLDVSSTDLRDRFADGRPLDYLLTGPVIDCIERHRIYPRSAAAEATPA